MYPIKKISTSIGLASLLAASCLEVGPAPFQDVGPYASFLSPQIQTGTFYIFTDQNFYFTARDEGPGQTLDFVRRNGGITGAEKVYAVSDGMLVLRQSGLTENEIHFSSDGSSFVDRTPGALPNNTFNITSCADTTILAYTDENFGTEVTVHARRSQTAGQSWTDDYTIATDIASDSSGNPTGVQGMTCFEDNYYFSTYNFWEPASRTLFHTESAASEAWTRRPTFNNMSLENLAALNNELLAFNGESLQSNFYYSSDNGSSRNPTGGYEAENINGRGLTAVSHGRLTGIFLRQTDVFECRIVHANGGSFQELTVAEHGADCFAAMDGEGGGSIGFLRGAAGNNNRVLYGYSREENGSDASRFLIHSNDLANYEILSLPSVDDDPDFVIEAIGFVPD